MIKNISKIIEQYEKGENIIEYLKMHESDVSKLERIRISYDIQAGSYIKKYSENPAYENERAEVYSGIINQLNNIKSILEVGVGEATTLSGIMKNVHGKYLFSGMDLSFSRLLYAQSHLNSSKYDEVNLYMGNIINMPFMDNSIDVVYSNHTLEPNGGNEISILKELYRVTNKYLVLFEPIYELGSEKTKAHIDKHGFIKNLYQYCAELNYKIIEYRELFSQNPLSNNNTGVLIIEKNKGISGYVNGDNIACPNSKMNMSKYDGSYYCRESALAYPVIKDIPCLLPENAILATHYLDELK